MDEWQMPYLFTQLIKFRQLLVMESNGLVLFSVLNWTS